MSTRRAIRSCKPLPPYVGSHGGGGVVGVAFVYLIHIVIVAVYILMLVNTVLRLH